MNLPLLDAGIFYELQISDQRPADLLEEAVAFEGSLRLHYNPGLAVSYTHLTLPTTPYV